MHTERRHHARRGVVCRVDYADIQGRAWLGLIRDLSLEGMFVEYTPELLVGSTVVATFTLPGSPPFKLRARVVRLTTSGAGLQFIGFSEQNPSQYPDTLESYCALLYRAWMSSAETADLEQLDALLSDEQEPAYVGSEAEE